MYHKNRGSTISIDTQKYYKKKKTNVYQPTSIIFIDGYTKNHFLSVTFTKIHV